MRAFEHDIALRVLTPRDGPLVSLLNEAGVPAEVVPAPQAMLRGSQQPGRILSSVPAAVTLPLWARALRTHRFSRDADVFYSIGFKTHLATTFPFGKGVAWHLHEFPPETTGPVWQWLAGRIPDALIANSRAVAVAWMGPEEKSDDSAKAEHTSLFSRPILSVVPNGVDLDRFKPRPRSGWIHQQLGLDPSVRLLGMPAVFARWKGHELVLEAFRAVAADFPDVHLVFVGGSIYDTVAERQFGERLAQLVSQVGASNAPEGKTRVHVLPFQSRIELAYPEFEITLHYSLRPEPFGRVILESMACGVPVLAANEGGPIEILGVDGMTQDKSSYTVPGIGGWLVTPRNAAGLAETLKGKLSASRDELSRIGKLGRLRAEDHFSARAFARGVAETLWALD